MNQSTDAAQDTSGAAASTSRALVPYAMRLNATLVRKGFWPKIRQLAAHAPFAEDAVALFFCARDRETPVATKAMLLAALAVFVVPRPFRPKRVPIPGLVLADDAAIIAAAVAMARKAIQPRHRDHARRALNRFAYG